jgi:hypothetical protein
MRYEFNPERLAYWYFRLNGFLTIENFIVHDEYGGAQRTDIDLIGLRFPNRREALRTDKGKDEWMLDDPRFGRKTQPFAAFVEVAAGECKLNGPWTDRAKENMPRAIRALGTFSTEEEVQLASDALYATGRFISEQIELGLISIGGQANPSLTETFPHAVQIEWRETIDFIFDRFHKFEREKRGHPQWDLDGHLLWHAFQEHNNDKEAFGNSLVLFGVQPSGTEIAAYIDSKRRR